MQKEKWLWCGLSLLAPLLLSLPGPVTGMSSGAAPTGGVLFFYAVFGLHLSVSIGLSRRLWLQPRLFTRRQLTLLALGGLALAGLGGSPWLDDDLYRYMWDGRSGYLGHPALLGWPDEAGPGGFPLPLWERMSYRSVPGIYPPLAQYFFQFLWWLWGPVPWLWLLSFTFVAGGCLLLCSRLAAGRQVPLWYLWLFLSGFVWLKELADSGHVDSLGLLLVIPALWPGGGRRLALVQGGLWGLAAMVKPLALVLLILGPLPWRDKAGRLLVAAGAAAGIGWIYFGGMQGLLWYGETLRMFSRYWVFNPGPADALRALFFGGDISAAAWNTTADYLRWLLLILLAAGGWLSSRVCHPVLSLWLCGLALILPMAVNPWYLAWLLPPLLLAAGQGRHWWLLSAPWLLLMNLSFQSYVFWLDLQDLAWQRRLTWLLWAGFLLLVLGWYSRRRRLARTSGSG